MIDKVNKKSGFFLVELFVEKWLILIIDYKDIFCYCNIDFC